MAFMDPRKVDSPRGRWKLIDVLFSGGDGDAAIAVGEWDNARALAVRWNGSDSEPGMGNPQSRGIATWFIVPEWLHASVLECEKIPEAKRSLAKALLDV